MADPLAPKHRLFVEAYAGDVVQAMQVAGYVGDVTKLEQDGNKLLTNPNILTAIKERSKYLTKTNEIVADREERQAFLSAVMRNQDPHRMVQFDEFDKPKKAEPIPMNTRLKALELLGKSEGDFTENINLQGNVTVTDIVSRSYEIPDEDLDAIEAEYEEIRNAQEGAEQEEPEEAEEETQADDDSGVGSERGSSLPDEEPGAGGLRSGLAGLI
ncbi:MAG: putative terminase small subunit [Prokaryotic dsDNA virus sp.]|mgnify:CR=1 FL=1|nr:MAG: putative terminase small subunit [Prokaryotic dsDNA virus sp.]|tara:strand:+ start:311 stop:952 length:642 start_codon:yes stop_codon:yes gene_type:complete